MRRFATMWILAICSIVPALVDRGQAQEKAAPVQAAAQTVADARDGKPVAYSEYVGTYPAEAAKPARGGSPATPAKPERRIICDLVPIPAGKFLMGSPDKETGRKKDEGPQIEVEVDAFWMGKHEVTWDEFQFFVNEQQRAWDLRQKKVKIPPEKLVDAVSIPTAMWEQEARPILNAMGQFHGFPAASMSHFSARQYTKWLSKKTGRFYRLPTEAEWEYACRAGATSAYSFGNDQKALETHAIFFNNSEYDGNLDLGHPWTHSGYRKVGTKTPNAWGLYDMHGNVAEWCIDQHDPNHYAKFAGKTVKANEIINWPKNLLGRVARGGHYDSREEECRSASRLASDKKWNELDPQLPKSIWWMIGHYYVGFRVIRPANEPSEEEKRKFWDSEVKEIRDILEGRSHASDGQDRVLVEPKKH